MSCILDSRDLHNRLAELREIPERIKELKEELAEVKKQIPFEEDLDDHRDTIESLEEELQETREEFENIKHELEELEHMEDTVPEWDDGALLIPEEDFIEYTEDLCVDCGDIPKELPHYIVIDWDATAENIKADYSEIEYNGTTYLYRDC